MAILDIQRFADRRFGSMVGFSETAELMVQLSNFKNPRWRYTRTVVARNPCVSWAFLFGPAFRIQKQPDICVSHSTCNINSLVPLHEVGVYVTREDALVVRSHRVNVQNSRTTTLHLAHRRARRWYPDHPGVRKALRNTLQC